MSARTQDTTHTRPAADESVVEVPDPAETPDGGSPTAPSNGAEAPVFNLRVTPDQVSVLLDCPDPLRDLDKVLDEIMKGFADLNLPDHPDRGLTRAIIEAAATPGNHLVRHTLILGVAATPPEPGRIAWSQDYFATGWAVDADSDRMDFWEPLGRRTVSGGEELCRVLPPRAGVPGLNVFGKEISVPTLKPAKLRLGKNVSEAAGEDGVRIVTADCDGRVRYALDTVTVDDVYVIKGDVGLETGNIRHKGAVMVHGDVRNGAVIETNGDVAVRGLIEASHIRCGGDLTVGGGIVGDGEGEIEVGGNVEALYISEARVRAGGDVVVKNEIAHADIECRGKVRAEQGRIAGGRTVALKGIRVGEAGASGSTTTNLIAGFDPDLKSALDEHRAKLERLDAAREKLTEALVRFEDLPAAQAAAQEGGIAQLKKKLMGIDTARGKIHDTMGALKAAAAAEAVEELVIYKEVWSGTMLQLGTRNMYVRASVHKPRLVRRDRKRLILLPMGEGNTPTG